jgi:hypothetical protein
VCVKWQVNERTYRNVVLVVGLVEEDVFAIVCFGGEVLNHAVFADAVLGTKALPEFRADWGIGLNVCVCRV